MSVIGTRALRRKYQFSGAEGGEEKLAMKNE